MKRIIAGVLIIIMITSAVFVTSCKKDGEEDFQAYEVTEVNVIIGEGTEWELDGILSLPVNAGDKVPAVVLVHGSGGSDMDESGGVNHAYRPFKDIADYLSACGIAVLRYNKRTYTHIDEMRQIYKDLTLKEETIDDAVLAANILKNDSRIDSEKVFVLGHSLGGMAAPRIDAEGGNFAGLIIFAGSPRRFADIWYDQAMNEVNSYETEEMKVSGMAQIDEYMKYFDSFKDMTDEEAKEYTLIGATGYYYKEMDAYPSNEYLKNLEKPALIMQGGKDFQVFADKDYAEYQTLLQGKENVAFKLYPELNHFFVTSTLGTVKEYRKKEPVNPEVLQDICDWINAN